MGRFSFLRRGKLNPFNRRKKEQRSGKEQVVSGPERTVKRGGSTIKAYGTYRFSEGTRNSKGDEGQYKEWGLNRRSRKDRRKK